MTWTPELVSLVIAAICFLLGSLSVRSWPPGGWVATGLFFFSLFWLIPALALSLTTFLVLLLVVLVIVLIVFLVNRTPRT